MRFIVVLSSGEDEGALDLETADNDGHCSIKDDGMWISGAVMLSMRY
jgi:hypothetical protein